MGGKEEILPFTIAWINLKGVKSDRDMHYISLTHEIQKQNVEFTETGSRMW